MAVQSPLGIGQPEPITGYLSCATAQTKGDVLRLDKYSTNGNGWQLCKAVTDSAVSNPASCYCVLLEDVAAGGVVKVGVRGEFECLVEKASSNLSEGTTLIHGKDILTDDHAMCKSTDIADDGTVSTTTGFANARKAIAISLDAWTSETAGLIMCDFNGLEGFGTIQGIVDLT